MVDKTNNRISAKEVITFAAVLVIAVLLYFLLFARSTGRETGNQVMTGQQPKAQGPMPAQASPPSQTIASPATQPTSQSGGQNMNQTIDNSTEPVQPAQEVPTKIFVPEAVYSKSKGIVTVNVTNYAEKDVTLEKIGLVYGEPPLYKTFAEFDQVLSTIPSKPIDIVIKKGDSKKFVVEVNELPTEIWAVPTDHTAVAGIIKQYITVED